MMIMIFWLLLIIIELYMSTSDWFQPFENASYFKDKTDLPIKIFETTNVKNVYPLLSREVYAYALILGSKDIPPTNLNFSIYLHRLASFRHWPSDHPVSTIDLAENGFFYIDTEVPDRDNDSVMCSACCVTISRWKKEDNISEVHRRNSPACPFLLRLKEGENGEVNQETASYASIDPTVAQEGNAGEACLNLTGNTGQISPGHHHPVTSFHPGNRESVISQENDTELFSSIFIGTSHPQSSTPEEGIDLSSGPTAILTSNANYSLPNSTSMAASQLIGRPRAEAEATHLNVIDGRHNMGGSTFLQREIVTPQSAESPSVHSYFSVNARRETFQFSGLSPDEIDALVEEGFYYTESGVIRCFNCGVEIPRWRSLPPAQLTHRHLNVHQRFARSNTLDTSIHNTH
ncbi:baculoviral IAP repeat-containing protein 7-A [Biomphalaria pfeifferi]|uniref:Baculoviral IAP repeat-containing protein 7-A n=1 Tax=Biomphalaria pfeifferi TaxID=112525 RepID=A0AAD8AXK4_BIOPF|nr:baculoviral IAP repeat-containing protein 7-A [Biomphalaria pfeifferi]